MSCTPTLWEVYRRPRKLWSGGPGSGLFKSTDGGNTWTELTRSPGLARRDLGPHQRGPGPLAALLPAINHQLGFPLYASNGYVVFLADVRFSCLARQR